MFSNSSVSTVNVIDSLLCVYTRFFVLSKVLLKLELNECIFHFTNCSHTLQSIKDEYEFAQKKKK